jgi:hypothetical protein
MKRPLKARQANPDTYVRTYFCQTLSTGSYVAPVPPTIYGTLALDGRTTVEERSSYSEV